MSHGGADKLMKRETTRFPPRSMFWWAGREFGYRDAVENCALAAGRIETWDATDDLQLRRFIRHKRLRGT